MSDHEKCKGSPGTNIERWDLSSNAVAYKAKEGHSGKQLGLLIWQWQGIERIQCLLSSGYLFFYINSIHFHTFWFAICIEISNKPMTWLFCVSTSESNKNSMLKKRQLFIFFFKQTYIHVAVAATRLCCSFFAIWQDIIVTQYLFLWSYIFAESFSKINAHRVLDRELTRLKN